MSGGPRHHHSDARLVPIELISAETAFGSEIRLRCTRAEARSLPATQDFAYIRLADAPGSRERREPPPPIERFLRMR
jgi:hypothetical protein